jgi:hypothetical protein
VKRSAISVGMLAGLAVCCMSAFVLGIVSDAFLPSNVEWAVILGLLVGALGVIGGATLGAVYSLATRPFELRKIPTDGPEADYRELS